MAEDAQVTPTPTYEGDPANFRTPLPYEDNPDEEVITPTAVAEAPTVVPVKVIGTEKPSAAEAEPEATEVEEDLGERAVEGATGNSVPIKDRQLAALGLEHGMPDQLDSTPAEKDTSEAETETDTSSDDAPKALKEKLKEGFRALPERTRSVLGRMYDRLLDEPELRRPVGKLHIAYNQFWLDRAQKHLAEKLSDFERVEQQIALKDENRAELVELVEELRADGMEAAAKKTEIRIQKHDRERDKLLRDKDLAQSALEIAENKAKLRTTKRDAVADRLIGVYDKELAPLETELEALQTAKAEVELQVAVTEAKHEELTLKMQGLAQRLEERPRRMRQAGMSEKEIREYMKVMNDRVMMIASQIDNDKAAIRARKLEIDERVALVDSWAQPYRDNREEFVRMKNSRPIEVDVEPRTRAPVFDGETPTVDHRRPLGEGTTGPAAEREASSETDPRPDISAYVSQWNSHLASKSLDGALPVELEDFVSLTGIREKTKIQPDKFKNILAHYLAVKKVPGEQYSTALADFLSSES